MTRDVHAVPWEGSGEHRANPHCPCIPVTMRDLAEPARAVFVHRSAMSTSPVRYRAVATRAVSADGRPRACERGAGEWPAADLPASPPDQDRKETSRA